MNVNGWVLVGPIIAALAAAFPAAAAIQQGTAAEPRCRVVEMDPRRGPARQTMCQRPDGSWQATANGPDNGGGMEASSGAALPPGWRGRIRYAGTLEGASQQQLRLPNRLTPNSVLGALNQTNGREFGGAYELQLTFEGSAVSGTYSGNGAGIGRGTISGTRDGSHCRLFTNTVIVEGECTAERFVGNGRSQGGGRTVRTARIETYAVDVFDAAEEERRQQAAAAEAEQERARTLAERQRTVEAQRARMAELPASARGSRGGGAPGNTDQLQEAIDAVIQLDSRSWQWNRYDIGSVGEVAISNAGSYQVARAPYTYNGGQPGWIAVQFSGEDIRCIEYHDFAGQCRAIGDNPATKMLATAVVVGMGAAMMAPTASRNNSEDSEDARMERAIISQQCRENGAVC